MQTIVSSLSTLTGEHVSDCWIIYHKKIVRQTFVLLVVLYLNTSWSLITSTWLVDSATALGNVLTLCNHTAEGHWERQSVCAVVAARLFAAGTRGYRSVCQAGRVALLTLVVRHTLPSLFTLHSSNDTLPTTRHSSVLLFNYSNLFRLNWLRILKGSRLTLR